MGISGQLNIVTDPTEFFAPLVLGTGEAPSDGYMNAGALLPLMPFTVMAVGSTGLFEISVTGTTNGLDGTFELPSFPGFIEDDLESAWIYVSLFGVPLYRCAPFSVSPLYIPPLNIYIYQPNLPRSAGITAGNISTALAGAGLPGNTQITAAPWGFDFSGSKSQANLQFGVMVVPDTSMNLGVFLDLSLNGYNINVGWPDSWCDSAGDILNHIKSGLQNADSSVNQQVRNQILNILQGPPTNLTPVEAQNLFNAVSIQFGSLTFDTNYTWPASNESDNTVVITPTLTLGYPASF